MHSPLILTGLNLDKLTRGKEIDKCSRDIPYFISNYLWIYEPRSREFLKFNLWPAQIKYINWLEEQYQNKKGGTVRKPRDMGITWASLGWGKHHWKFEGAFSMLLGSLKEDEVKKIPGAYDSLFSKLDVFITHLPDWLLPRGFSYDEHSLSMLLSNPENGSVFTGSSATPNFGLSKRASAILIDEKAQWQSDVSGNCRYTSYSTFKVSTVNGPNDPGGFRRDYDLAVETGEAFDFTSRDNPLHDDAWHEEQKQKTSPEEYARFVECNFEASVRGLVYEDVAKCPVGDYPYNPDLPLVTFADYGTADQTYIGFVQLDFENTINGLPELYLVDEVIGTKFDVEYYIPFWPRKELAPNPYAYTTEEDEQIEAHRLWKFPVANFGDPSGRNMSFAAKQSAWKTLKDYGIETRCNEALLKDWRVRITSARRALKRLKIDKKCQHFIRCVGAARFPSRNDGSQSTAEFSRPVHDWTEAPRSAWEYFAISENMVPHNREKKVERRENPYAYTRRW